MDWYSRHVLAWRLSNTMDTSFCLDALDDALRKGGQRSSTPTRGTIHQCGIYRRARSRGRAHQHGWPRALVGQRVRRALWRSLKCEEVHLKAGACPRAGRRPDLWANGLEARICVGHWLRFYNDSRPHQALGYRGGDMGGRGQPCGFAAALGRRWRVAHNPTEPTTADRGLHLTRKGSGLPLINALPVVLSLGSIALERLTILSRNCRRVLSTAGLKFATVRLVS